MLAIREEELNMVNGGNVLEELIGGPKFSDGDWVMSVSSPELGVGIVLSKEYNRGWFYTVAMDSGMLYTSQDDLEFAIK